MIKVADRLNKVHSDIRGPLYQEALRMEKEGIKVLKLNTGNPARFGFKLPESLRNVLVDNVDDAVAYCDVKGMPKARKAIMDYHKSIGVKNINEDDIFITNGVSEASSMILETILNKDDEILLPSPCYSLWSNNTYLCDAKPVFYRCDPENEFNPDVNDIKSKVSDKTKAILVINPNNPTGAVYSKEILKEIVDIAKKNNLLVLADEIYDRLVMDDVSFTPLSVVCGDYPCVTFNGLSKSHIICGFRCGWMLFSGKGKETLIENVNKLAAMRLCSNALTQLVIPAAMSDEKYTKDMTNNSGRLYLQREAVCSILDTIPGVSYVKTKAAFYIFPKIDEKMYDFKDANDFSMKFLHEKQVLVIPGSGFDWHEDIRFRIVMLPHPEELTQAMLKLKDFLNDHKVK